jgi:hypothetical protein
MLLDPLVENLEVGKVQVASKEAGADCKEGNLETEEVDCKIAHSCFVQLEMLSMPAQISEPSFEKQMSTSFAFVVFNEKKLIRRKKKKERTKYNTK